MPFCCCWPCQQTWMTPLAPAAKSCLSCVWGDARSFCADIVTRRGTKKEMWERERENAMPGWFPEVLCRAVKGKKKKKKKRIRDRRERGCKKRTSWSSWRLVVVAHLSGSHSLSQPGNAGRLEDFATSSAHAQRAPAAAPVLVFVVGMTNCALDWCVLVA